MRRSSDGAARLRRQTGRVSDESRGACEALAALGVTARSAAEYRRCTGSAGALRWAGCPPQRTSTRLLSRAATGDVIVLRSSDAAACT